MNNRSILELTNFQRLPESNDLLHLQEQSRPYWLPLQPPPIIKEVARLGLAAEREG